MRPFFIAASFGACPFKRAVRSCGWTRRRHKPLRWLEEIKRLQVHSPQLAGGKALNHQTARLAIGAAEEAWRQVRPDLMAAALQQARFALRNDPTAGDAARMRRLLCLEAAYEVGEFRAEKLEIS